MKAYSLFILLLGVALIVSRSFFSSLINIDYIVVIIYFLLCLPIAAKYLIRAKIFGAEFHFKDKIEEARGYVDKSREVAEKQDKLTEKSFRLFNLIQPKEILNSDPVLALASLRIEIERKLKDAHAIAYHDKYSKSALPLNEIVNRLKKKGWLYKDQVEALKRIIHMCNQALHGQDISFSDAQQIIKLADDLNYTFGLGYVPNFGANEDFDKNGLLCEWEHCIELMPLHEVRSNIDCPIFGHECPGGIGQVMKCKKSK